LKWWKTCARIRSAVDPLPLDLIVISVKRTGARCRVLDELRLKDRTGAYRVVYAVVTIGTVYVLHGFKKKTGATPKRNIEIARKRLMEVRQ